MTEQQAADLGDAQSTLFVPLTSRARETRRKNPALRDPKAVEIVESVTFDAVYDGKGSGFITIPRTLIFDHWARDFLGRHPDGTVIELGTGLNTRFERVDNGAVHWIDLDLPDVIELRRQFFDDSDRRTMLAASIVDEGWLDVVAERPGPYFFVADGVLPYLAPADVEATLERIAARFPDAVLAFDTYPRRMQEMQHKQAAKTGMAARWLWAWDDPGSLQRHGLRLLETTTIATPPPGLRRVLPARWRYRLALLRPLLATTTGALSLFRAG